MKKLFSPIVVFILLFVFSACADSHEQIPEPLEASQGHISESSETFSATELDFSDVKSIYVSNGMTGGSVLLTHDEDIKAVIDSAKSLHGTEPVSSRGYYGWTYGFSFYSTPSPEDTTAPLFRFSVCVYDDDVFITHGVYEIVERHTYSAMYKSEMADVLPIITLCDSYFQ